MMCIKYVHNLQRIGEDMSAQTQIPYTFKILPITLTSYHINNALSHNYIYYKVFKSSHNHRMTSLYKLFIHIYKFICVRERKV